MTAARRLREVTTRPDPPVVPAAVPIPPALALDLLAAVLSAGVPVPAALDALADALGTDPAAVAVRQLGARTVSGRDDPPSTTDGGPPLVTALTGALLLAGRAGLPPADLIRAAARRERARGAAVRRAAIRRLEVLLVVPAGLCLLPAFVLLGVVPVVIALLSG